MLDILAFTLVLGVALVHAYIVVLEMMLWTKPQGLKAFNLSPEFSQQTKTLGANQGLYNGFLVAALVLGMICKGEVGFSFTVFGLCCVIVAGLYGAITVSKKTFYLQTLPALAALICVLGSHGS